MKRTIFLISGIGLRPNLKLVKYWRNVPEIITSLGYEVVIVNVDAFGAIETNLEIIYQRITEYFSENAGIKIECHVWGHSKGGVEVLNLLANSSIKDKISTFVLLNTPIRGTLMAKRILNSPMVIRKLIVYCANFIGFLMGDRHPDFDAALIGLAKDYSALLAKRDNNLYIFQSSHSFGELPWVWKLAALLAYGRFRKGDGIIESQNIKGLWVNPIKINSIAIDRIMHSSLAGIPYFSGLNSMEFCHLWIELVNNVYNSNGN